MNQDIKNIKFSVRDQIEQAVYEKAIIVVKNSTVSELLPDLQKLLVTQKIWGEVQDLVARFVREEVLHR